MLLASQRCIGFNVLQEIYETHWRKLSWKSIFSNIHIKSTILPVIHDCHCHVWIFHASKCKAYPNENSFQCGLCCINCVSSFALWIFYPATTTSMIAIITHLSVQPTVTCCQVEACVCHRDFQEGVTRSMQGKWHSIYVSSFLMSNVKS